MGNKDIFIELNVNISDLNFHFSYKGAVTFCVSGCTVAPPITYNFLCTGCSVGNVKSCYLRYEVSGDQVCGQAVTVLDPVTSDLYVSHCHF